MKWYEYICGKLVVNYKKLGKLRSACIPEDEVEDLIPRLQKYWMWNIDAWRRVEELSMEQEREYQEHLRALQTNDRPKLTKKVEYVAEYRGFSMRVWKTEGYWSAWEVSNPEWGMMRATANTFEKAMEEAYCCVERLTP